MIPENLRCPKCGSGDLAEIIYGPVDMTEDLLRQVQARKVLIRNELPPKTRRNITVTTATTSGNTPWGSQ